MHIAHSILIEDLLGSMYPKHPGSAPGILLALMTTKIAPHRRTGAGLGRETLQGSSARPEAPG